MSEKPWFRWAFAALFVVAIFSLPLALGHPPQEQTYYEPAHRSKNIETPVSADERVADYTEALAWLTALLAIVSAVQGIFLYRSDQTARISADAAKVSADAVVSSADALPKVERAYLFLAPDIEYNIRFTTDSAIVFRFSNLGKTAAVITQISRYFDYVPRNVAPESITVPWVDLNTPMPVASGAQSEPFTAQTIITAAEFDDAEKGFGRLALIVRVAYLDIFDVRHETAFCQHKSGSWPWMTFESKALNFRT